MLLLAGAYFLAGKLGLRLAMVHPSATAVWPPAGIALAALLTLGYEVWPAIFAGAFLVNLTTAGSIATCLGIAAGNTLEGLVGAYLVNRWANGRNPFDRAPDAFRYALLAGMVSTAVSATIGVTSLALGGFARWADFGRIGSTWWLGDMGGDLVVAPVLLLWSSHRELRWRWDRVLEAGLLLAALAVLGQIVFGSLFPIGERGYPLEFACMPVLVWAAFRFDPRIAATAVLLLAVLAARGTLMGTGPFQRWERNESFMLLQVFMSVTALTTLALAATVSERRRVERALRAVSEELREAVSELEAFNHSVSHDLRSPIAAVLNYSAIMEQDFRDQLGEEGLRLLRRIRASGESASRLLDQLVQFVWAGRDGGERLHVDMTSLAREAYAEVSAGSEEATQVQFEFADLPPAQGSVALIGRVFHNLFSNAVKYTRGRDRRRIEVAGEAGEVENTYCVTDNGIGFDPRHGETVFQPFRRLDGARKIEGSGLGLAIAAKIVRRHGGRIWAESDGSSGARFCFTLPRRKPAT